MSEFSKFIYTKLYPDLRALEESDLARHYEEHGKAEGRIGTFDDFITEVTEEDERSGRSIRADLHDSEIIVISHESSLTGAPVVAFNMAVESAICGRRTTLITFGKIDAPLRALPSRAPKGCLSVVTLKMRYRNRLTGEVISNYVGSECGSIIASSIETSIFLSGLTSAPSHHDKAVLAIHEHPHNYNINWLEEAVISAGSIVFSSQFIRSAWHQLAVHNNYWGNKIIAETLVQRQPVQIIGEENGGESIEDQGFYTLPTGGGSQPIRIVGAGYVQYRKGVDIFIRTIRKIALMNPSLRLSALWIGKSDEADYFCKAVQHMLSECASIENIFITIRQPFAGYRRAIAEADFVFFPARYDPLPNFIIDCLDCGKIPFVISGATGFDEIYRQILPNTLREKRLVDEFEAKNVLEKAFISHVGNKYTDSIDLERAYAQEILASFPSQTQYLEILTSLRHERPANRCVPVRAGFYDIDREIAKAGTSKERIQEISNILTRWGINPMYETPSMAFIALCHAYNRALPNKRNGLKATISQRILLQSRVEASELEKTPKVDLHIHCHYAEEIARTLDDVSGGPWANIYLTHTVSLDKAILENYPEVRFVRVSNIGRNLAPLMSLAGTLSSEYILHIHVKRSAHNSEGLVGKWKNFLYTSLIGSRRKIIGESVSKIIMQMDCTQAVIAYPLDQHRIELGRNTTDLNRLLRKSGSKTYFHNTEHFPFPVGAMFYCSRGYLESLADFWKGNIGKDEYLEPIPPDGTILHALERFLPLYAARNEGAILVLDKALYTCSRGPRRIGV